MFLSKVRKKNKIYKKNTGKHQTNTSKNGTEKDTQHHFACLPEAHKEKEFITKLILLFTNIPERIEKRKNIPEIKSFQVKVFQV